MKKINDNKSSLLQWSDDCSVGHPILDLQHRKLLTIFAELNAQMRQDSSLRNNRVESLLYYLQSYTKMHFDTEEQVLREAGYSDIESHIQEHRALASDLDHIYTSAVMGSLDAARLQSFITTWAMDHILQSDMKYKGGG